jgi:hypothetical protein
MSSTSWCAGVNGTTGPVIWSTLYISWIRLDKGILAHLVSPGTALTSWSADE